MTDIEHWHQMLSTADEVRELRDATGAGLAMCKRQIVRQNIEDALTYANPQTPTERVLVACLRAALHEGMI